MYMWIFRNTILNNPYVSEERGGLNSYHQINVQIQHIRIPGIQQRQLQRRILQPWIPTSKYPRGQLSLEESEPTLWYVLLAMTLL